MANDPDKYLAVLKAAYDYSPQSEDEIEIKEDQILFLKERVDDDWWKVKVRGSSQDDDSPVGLVPAAYVEPADHTSVVKAVYDYTAAAPVLLVYDTEDEWLLVQSKTGDKAGFVPANYVEACSEDAEEEEHVAPPQIIIPPSPPRPVSTYVDPADRVASTKVTADDIQTWSVSEVDKKGKKMKGTLGIGNGAVFFASETSKAAVQKWQTGHIVNISTEKSKHVHFDVDGPNPTSLHFSVGSRDNTEAIVAKLESSRALAVDPPQDPEEPEPEPVVEEPPKKPSVHFSNNSPVIIPPRPSEASDDETETEGQGSAGVALYDFTAAGDDELSVKEGERLIIVEMDEEDWWKCRNGKNQEGMVPSSYLELTSKGGSTPPSSRSPEPEPVEDDDTEAREAEERAAAEAAAAAAAAAQAEARAKREEEKKKEEARRRARIAAEQADAKRKERQASPKHTSPLPSVAHGSALANQIIGPPAERVRFRVDAAFVGMNNGKLRLHKLNGVIVEVPSEKMSHEDMRYVEKLTSKKSRPPATHKMSEDDIPIGVQYPNATNGKAARAPQGPKKPTVDWFKFFLDAGCDIDDCTRYSTSFERERMDEAVLLDTSEGTLRSLGLREGDIIRVIKVVEKRKVKPNGEGEQVRSDEELAKQLHAEINGSKPAPNIFTGPGGALKTQPRRGRPQPSKSLPPATVDLNSIGKVVPNITGADRTASPQLLSPASTTAVQPPQRASSTVPVVSGFDDDAWTNRPSSTKPLTPAIPPAAAAAARAPSAPPPATTTFTAPANPPPTSQPLAAATSTGHSFAKTTESDIFDQLSRLSELRKNTPAPQPPPTPPAAITSPASYRSGLGMGSSPAPIGQHLHNQQTGMISQPTPPPAQPYNGPRGPFAPVPGNQGLLQPLIPTQTGFNSFIPTRSTGAAVSPFGNNSSPPSFLTSQPTGFPPQQPQIMSQPTGFPGAQPMMSQPTGFQPNLSQPTGMPLGGFNGGSPFMNGGMSGVMSNPTGINPSFGHFGNGMSSPPPVPPLPNTNNTNPANIFAQMKSGTFAQDNEPRPAAAYDALRTNPIQTQPTGWGGFGGTSYVGYQR
ncbi:hypothetical protein EDD18DRAFT_1201740 [Armillaria luteobubalina]|uniref:Actin cytoskeleton-regulatory complex protein SLA1 n=1 Tax=Armillaria luteobubalina TaxID=153913 RepID=A0AA39PD57_9AGAR|nr:hypothetical protein EDD18DRAFT_1201740 [Armillaria luteobubalina]